MLRKFKLKNKYLTFALVIMFLIPNSSIANAQSKDDNTIFALYAETETIECEVLYERLIGSKSTDKTVISDFGTRSVLDYRTFQMLGHKFDRMTLYALDINGDRLSVGTHDVNIWYEWEETWSVDEFGNKLKLYDQTSKLIMDAIRDYHCIPGWTIWETDWDEGIGTNKARGIGNVSGSATGTEAFTHTVYAPR